MKFFIKSLYSKIKAVNLNDFYLWHIYQLIYTIMISNTCEKGDDEQNYAPESDDHKPICISTSRIE